MSVATSLTLTRKRVMSDLWIPSSECLGRLHADHDRDFHDQRYVYAVLSRRSRGISVGLNLNPDRACNFDCVYCQVDRRTLSPAADLDLGILLRELEATLDAVTSGAIYRDRRFEAVPRPLRRLNDIAFSGDGEPTAVREFDAVVEAVASLKRAQRLDPVKLVLITNATLLHRPTVRRALEVLDAHQGEIWAKLDAGTEAYYRSIDRSVVRFDRILGNLLETSRRRPIVIQSLFASLEGKAPSDEEVLAYSERLRGLIAGGGKIALVQVHTVARAPADARVSPLSDEALQRIGTALRERVDVPVAVF